MARLKHCEEDRRQELKKLASDLSKCVSEILNAFTTDKARLKAALLLKDIIHNEASK